MTAHKILEKYTNKTESLNHLRAEIDNYRENIFSFINESNWNEDDKIRIKQEALKSLKSELKERHFNNVKFPENEPEKLIDEVLKELMG